MSTSLVIFFPLLVILTSNHHQGTYHQVKIKWVLPAINQNSRNRDLTEIKRYVLDFGLGVTDSKKYLNCIPPNYKMGKAYESKKLQGYSEFT